MNAYKTTANIPEERKIILNIPSSLPVGPVEIIMLYPEKNEKANEESIKKLCGSFKGSRFTSERHMRLKKEEKELER